MKNIKLLPWKNLEKYWYNFSRNRLSIIGLFIVILIIFLSIFSLQIVPFPKHIGAFVDLDNMAKPPSTKYIFGTDLVGRDIFSRTIFAYRGALFMALIVLSISVPIGVLLGLTAGYYKNTWIDNLIMRITDVFISLPSLILALAIASVLKPTLTNAMIAVSISWWPWFTRLVYGVASSLRNENYVIFAEINGASTFYILFREILPNCLSPIFTKMALDIGWIILLGASLSFVGLGQQPPIPALGSMVSEGSKYMPDYWWIAMFPALAIMFIILGFNLLGDGIRDMLEKGRD